MVNVGYGRVSKRDQNPNSQYDALAAAGCDPIFIDKASGKLEHRPELDKALLVLRKGDVLTITRLERLARSTKQLHHIVLEELKVRGVNFRVIEQGIDTTTSAGRYFFKILAAHAEFEHDLIVERTLDGLAAARARGRTGGRKTKMTPARVDQARKMYAEVGPDGKRLHTVQDIADTFGVTRPTIYRHLEPTGR